MNLESNETLSNEPEDKRVLLEEDPRTKAILAMSRYCQEQWVTRMVRLHMSRDDLLTVTLLSGDAGCGKSYAIALLERTLRSMGVSVVVSAMTNKAAATLMDSCSLDRVYTFHKMMGFTRNLLDDTLSLQDFTLAYCTVYRNMIARFDALRRSEVPRESIATHSCARTCESCAVCSKMFERLRVPEDSRNAAPMEDALPFLGVNVLVVDEYRLMNAELLERMLCCAALFYGAGKLYCK